jgi:hypothetical protein
VFSLLLFVVSTVAFGRTDASPDSHRCATTRTVSDVLKSIGPGAEARLKPYFEEAGISYPPRQIALIGLKDEMKLELWAKRDAGWVHIRTYEILAASGDVSRRQGITKFLKASITSLR